MVVFNSLNIPYTAHEGYIEKKVEVIKKEIIKQEVAGAGKLKKIRKLVISYLNSKEFENSFRQDDIENVKASILKKF
jgi:hypothetical protein